MRSFKRSLSSLKGNVRSNMIQQQQEQPSKVRNVNNGQTLRQPKTNLTKLQQIVYNGGTSRLHFLAQSALQTQQEQHQQDPPVDPPVQSKLQRAVSVTQGTLLWKLLIPIGSKVRKRILVFKQIQYVLSNWTGDKFPSVIYLCLDNFQGYFGSDGMSTNRVAALELQDMNPVLDDADLRTYDLKYVIKETISWQLPLTLLDLRLRVKLDDETLPMYLPLPNPLSVDMQIRTE